MGMGSMGVRCMMVMVVVFAAAGSLGFGWVVLWWFGRADKHWRCIIGHFVLVAQVLCGRVPAEGTSTGHL